MSSSKCVSSFCNYELKKPEPEVDNKNMKNDLYKYSFFPVNYPKLIEYFDKQTAVVWTVEEINIASDREDWDNLEEDVKEFVKFNLFFFAQADGIVNENLIKHFKEETSEIKEASFFYSSQEFIEVIHNKTYSTLIEAYIRDDDEKMKAFNAIENYPSIKKLADWMFSWMDPSKPLLERVVAFACVEGVFFSSAFASIYWLKRKNILKGLCKANEFIARDEALHTEFAVALYHVITSSNQLKTKEGEQHKPLKESRVHDIINSAVNVSEEFTKNALRVDLVGINSDDMVSYVKCTANKLCESFGYKKIYDVENPFNWMAVISLPNKSNFFETKPTEYARQSKADFCFDLNTPF